MAERKPSIPDDFEMNGATAPEPDAAGYVRPESFGPELPQEPANPYAFPVAGQYQTQGGAPLRDPQPLRPQAPEYVAQPLLNQPSVLTDPTGGLAPLPRELLRCASCGLTQGVFYRDPYSGAVRHQGCAPGVTRGVTQPGAGVQRQFSVKDAKEGMQPPEQTV